MGCLTVRITPIISTDVKLGQDIPVARVRGVFGFKTKMYARIGASVKTSAVINTRASFEEVITDASMGLYCPIDIMMPVIMNDGWHNENSWSNLKGWID